MSNGSVLRGDYFLMASGGIWKVSELSEGDSVQMVNAVTGTRSVHTFAEVSTSQRLPSPGSGPGGVATAKLIAGACHHCGELCINNRLRHADVCAYPWAELFQPVFLDLGEGSPRGP
jgi:hypothetical protein